MAGHGQKTDSNEQVKEARGKWSEHGEKKKGTIRALVEMKIC